VLVKYDYEQIKRKEMKTDFSRRNFSGILTGISMDMKSGRQMKAESAFAVACVLAASALAGVNDVKLDTSADRVESPLAVSMKRIGTLKPRSVSEIAGSNWMIGCETLDRDYMNFDEYKEYIAPMGIRLVRLQAGWAKTEQKKGVYDFAWLDHIVYYLRDRGIGVFMDITYGNPIYEGAGGWDLGMGLPSSPEGKAAWDRWVDALTRHYADTVKEWTIWNEPDTGGLTGKLKDKGDVVELNIRTADIVRRNVPDAKIALYNLASIHLGYLEDLLRLTPKSTFAKCHSIAYHDYQVQPEATYPKLEAARMLLKKYGAENLIFRQTENGCPSEMAILFALGKIQWSEYSQAKWYLRRMMGDLGHDVPGSVFTLSEFNHRANKYRTAEINHKGLIRINANREVIGIKRAYYAVQNVVSVFDDTLVRVKGPADVKRVFSATGELDAGVPVEKPLVSIADLTISHFEYETRDGDKVLVFWDHGDIVRHPFDSVGDEHAESLELNPNVSHRFAVRPSDSFETRPIAFDYSGRPFADPVWVDLLTGRIYAFPKRDQLVHSAGVTFVNVPAYDSPCILTERRAVVR